MDFEFELTAEHVRSGRALLQWSQGDLAKYADVAVSTIADFEKGLRIPIANNLAAIREALANAGVRFTPEGASVGVALFLMSESNSADLVLQYTEKGVTAVKDVLSVFGDIAEGAVSIAAVQAATPALKMALNDLVAKHASTTPPIHRLRKFVSVLRDDEHFLVLPGRPASTAEKLACEQLLHRLNNPDEADEADGVKALFGALLERYDMSSPRTDRHTVIRSRHRRERKCRFCRRTALEGATFDQVAHAIPTALGNDFLKLADECDDCNGYFGKETEPSLVAFLDIQRAFLGIQGRGKNDGRPELEFAEGKVFHDGKRLNIHSKDVSKEDETGAISVGLGKGRPIVPAAVYRALVKIALSVVDEDDLAHLSRTVDWVRYGKHPDQKLPAVAAAIAELPPNPSAQITVYRRKTAQSRLPHFVGEFRLGPYLYVFAVPLSDCDSWDLIGFFDDAEFRETFKHYTSVTRWNQQDLNGREKVWLSPQIKLVPRQK
jgi:transcriptional regulator with XRE-family HTH domain